MTIPSSKYGQTDRTAKTFWIDQPLRPVVKRIAAKRRKLSESDVINHALYQLPEVQRELRKEAHLQEQRTHGNQEDTTNADRQ